MDTPYRKTLESSSRREKHPAGFTLPEGSGDLSEETH
jgi:hypothetical protein